MPRAPKLTSEQGKDLASDYSAGLSLTALCDKYGLSRPSVLNYVDKAGLTRRSLTTALARAQANSHRVIPAVPLTPSPIFLRTLSDGTNQCTL